MRAAACLLLFLTFAADAAGAEAARQDPALASGFAVVWMVALALVALYGVWTAGPPAYPSLRPAAPPSPPETPPQGPSAAAALLQRLQAPAPQLPVEASAAEWSHALIQRLEWKRFEELCESLWRLKGYRVMQGARGDDGSADTYLYSPAFPDQVLAVLHCKAWEGPVGVEPVRAHWNLAQQAQAKLALFYARSGFTGEASIFAAGKHLRLYSGQDLLNQISGLPFGLQRTLRQHTARGDFITPSCPRCTAKMAPAGASWHCVSCAQEKQAAMSGEAPLPEPGV